MDTTYKYSEDSCYVGKVNLFECIHIFVYIYMFKLLEKRS